MKVAYQVVTEDMKLYTPAYEVVFVGDTERSVGFIFHSRGTDTFIPFDSVAFYTRVTGEFTIEDVIGAFGKEDVIARTLDHHYGEDLA